MAQNQFSESWAVRQLNPTHTAEKLRMATNDEVCQLFKGLTYTAHYSANKRVRHVTESEFTWRIIP